MANTESYKLFTEASPVEQIESWNLALETLYYEKVIKWCHKRKFCCIIGDLMIRSRKKFGYYGRYFYWKFSIQIYDFGLTFPVSHTLNTLTYFVSSPRCHCSPEVGFGTHLTLFDFYHHILCTKSEFSIHSRQTVRFDGFHMIAFSSSLIFRSRCTVVNPVIVKTAPNLKLVNKMSKF